MGSRLEVTSGVIATLREEASRAAPREACGLLLGRAEEVRCAVRADNVHPTPLRHFEIDPVALIAAHRAARQGGPAVLGYFHSHPTGLLAPSAVDRAQASGDGRVWAIVAPGAGEGDITFWRDGEGGFEPLSYRVVDG